MLKLADLSDLDLVALLSALHEAVLSVCAIQGALDQVDQMLTPWALVKELHGAARVVGSEAIARRLAAPPRSRRLFPGEHALPAHQMGTLCELTRALARKLESQGFPKVAQLLEERLSTETRVETNDAAAGVAADLRTLN